MDSVQPPADLINSDPYLASYELPRLTFGEREDEDLILEPLWHALRSREYRRAQAYGHFALKDVPTGADPSTHAALYVGVAVAELRLRNTQVARRMALSALETFPVQWAGHRVLLDTLIARKEYRQAIEHASSLFGIEGKAP